MRSLLVLVLLCACAAHPVRVAAEPIAFAPFEPGRREAILAAMPAVERLVAAEAARLKLPGLAAGLVVDGELVWTKSLGVRDVASKAPADADTLFRIASMSKAFTGVAILQLRDAGVLRLDDPAETWLPELAQLRYPTGDSPKVTLRDLLTHGAGFPEDNPSGDLTLPWPADRLLKILHAGGAFATAPDTHYEYSNLGFELLGLVVARASGEPFDAYMKAHVLGPLGMTASVYDPQKVPADRVAQGYGKESAQPVEPLGYGVGAPMGGLYSSVRELSRWAAFQLDAWPPRDGAEGSVLRRSSRREAQRGWRFSSLGASRVGDTTLIGASSYGYGWGATQTCEFETTVSHSGGLPGFGSNIRFLPERGVAFIALANQTYAPMAKLTYDALALLEPVLPRRKAQPAAALARALDGIEYLYAEPSVDALQSIWDAQVLAYLTPGKLLAAVQKLREQHGNCRRTGFEAENALRGKLTLACERGGVEAFVTMSPQVPPRVQQLDWTSLVPAQGALLHAAETATALLSGWDDGTFTRLAPALPLARTRALFQLADDDHGACKLDPRARDGVFTLSCDHGKLDLKVAVDAAGHATELTVKNAGRCAL